MREGGERLKEMGHGLVEVTSSAAPPRSGSRSCRVIRGARALSGDYVLDLLQIDNDDLLFKDGGGVGREG